MVVDQTTAFFLSLAAFGSLAVALIRYRTVLLGFTFFSFFLIARASLSAFLFGYVFDLSDFWITEAHLWVFAYSAAGLIAFSLGIMLAWRPLRQQGVFFASLPQKLPWLNSQFAWWCIILGGLAYLLQPIAHAIPTVQAIWSGYLALLQIGVLVALAYNRSTGESRPLIFSLVFFSFFVLLQATRTGFIGAGGSFLFQLLLVACFWKRVNLRSVVIFVAGTILLLGLIFGWLGSRDIIRGGELAGFGAYGRITVFLQRFDYINLLSLSPRTVQQRLFERIDSSYILAAQARYQPYFEPYAHGKTILSNLLAAVVPRVLWPDKPIQVGGSAFVSRYSGLHWPSGTSVGLPYQFELYANGGALWVIVGLFLIGWLTARLELLLFEANYSLPQFMGLLFLTYGVAKGAQTFVAQVMSILAGVIGYFILGKVLEVLNKDWHFWKATAAEPESVRLPQLKHSSDPGVILQERPN